MAEIQHLLDLADERIRDKTLLAEAGAAALWDTAFYGDDSELFDPAATLLHRVVRLEVEAPSSINHSAAYYTARNHLSHLALYQTVAAQEIFSDEQLRANQCQLAEVLRESRAETHERSDTTQLAQLTFQALLARRRDPGHVAFPAPPFAADADFWYDDMGNMYPRSNLFITANDGTVASTAGRIIPTQVRATARGNTQTYPKLFPGIHVVWLGPRMNIGMRMYSPADYKAFIMSMAKHWRSCKAILVTADMLLAESEGEDLPKERRKFLDEQGDYLTGKLEETALPVY